MITFEEINFMEASLIKENMTKEIIKAEEKLRLAMVTSNIDELDQLISNDLVFTNHLGQVISKNDDIAAHKKGDLKISNIALSEHIINFSGTTAIVSAHAKITGSYQNLPANGNFRFTRVWEKKADSWQVFAGHASIVA